MEAFTLFNQCIISFVKDMASIYPKDQLVLKLAKIGLTHFIKNNPETLATAFAKFSEPYAAHIRSQDGEFFLGISAQQYKQEYKAVKAEYAVIDQELKNSKRVSAVNEKFDTLIGVIKSRWAEMDDENRAVVWEYLSSLLSYSDAVAAR
jgi:hypothetical protein